MASLEPIVVALKDSMWHVDFQDGTTQNFATKGEAVHEAEKVAAREGRQVIVK
jgi:hypothetical protein